MPNDIESFVEWVINQRPETSKIPPEEKAIMQKNLVTRLDEMANKALLAEMTPEQMEEFNHVLDQGSDEKIEEFVEHAVPHSQDIVTGVLAEFAKMYLGENHGRAPQPSAS